MPDWTTGSSGVFICKRYLGRLVVGIMAVNLLMPLLIPLGEQITNVTHLSNVGNLAFQLPWMEVYVSENTPPALLLTLQATTNTSSRDVFYSIVSGGLNGLFVIDSSSGRLTLTSPLDYEVKNSYELITGAMCGEERAFAQVVVKVKDTNDLPPTFPRPIFETQITEEDDRHLPKAILQVAAHDGDISDANKLRYSLYIEDSPESTDIFTITNNTGFLYLLQALDRDAPSGRPRWHLRVTATDGLHSAHALVHVNVKDINDNAPFFPHETVNATIMENSQAGEEILRVSALDNDDPKEGTNAILSYSVEKNVIDEHSGQHIFNIDPESGRLFTAQCCLDRERTPFYAIQVVAADGGGLKGTGTVVVTVGDENDVAPRFSRSEWLLTIHETVPLNTTLALLTVEDPDITNDFAFRIVANSGYGWERFRVVPVGDTSGALQILQKLDFEDPLQRQGFRFKVQVSDKGDAGWGDDAHQAETWVVVGVVDDNDNPPLFSTKYVNLTLPEDTPAGLSLTMLSATDADKGLAGDVHYTIDTSSDPRRQFTVDADGVVRLRRPLDRETSPVHLVRILAVDGGQPPLTATSSLFITVTDINDNAPHVANPEGVFVPENSKGPRHVADLILDDEDDWSLGHGPPFAVHLDRNAPIHIREAFEVTFDDRSNEAGGGIVVLRSLKPLDREDFPQRLVPLVMSDAEGFTTTATVTVTVSDVNDNPMRPASKSITVKKFTGGTSMMMIGRVYVDDPDDWDGGEKIWAWKSRYRHHLFSLEESTGRLSMQANASDGRYLLQFVVSDPVHKQRDVSANVTVTVSSYSRDVVNCAVPVTITTHSPRALIVANQSTNRSPLESLIASVESVANVEVAVLSLEEDPIRLSNAKRSGTRLWLTASLVIPLDQLLLLHRLQISNESGVGILDVGVGVCVSIPSSPSHPTFDYMWVVDANSTALVTPRLATFNSGCSCQAKPELLHRHHHHHSFYYQHHQKALSNASQGHHPNVAAVTHSSFCLPNPCLNGGRCIPSTPAPRCVCPDGTTGSVCKQLSRHFLGRGWIWVVPIPAVSEVHLTLEFQTQRADCLVLYSGPRDDYPLLHHQNRHLQEDVLSLELREGRPRLLLDLGTGPVFLILQEGHALDDGRWHRIDIFWGNQKAEMVVDLCQASGGEHCRVRAPLPPGSEALDVGAPLHVGGLTHAPPHHQDYSWPHPITSTSFAGCIRNLRVNGELRDFGEGVLGEDSRPGCPKGDECQQSGHPCPDNSRCVTRTSGDAFCECDVGWASPSCSHRTKPASFNANSYVRVALSSSPTPNVTTLQLRFRTWEQFGQMVAVSSQHGKDALTLQLVKGRLCAQLVLHPKSVKLLCLQEAHLNDGRWHSVHIDRFGEWMELRVDDGDGPFYNTTATPVTSRGWVAKLNIDRQEGIHVGGSPDYVGVSLYTVLRDFHNGCLDDLRVTGMTLPMPPLDNSTQWAQATLFANVHEGCHGGTDVCANVSCPNPFTCLDLWRRHHCGCDEGTALSQEGDLCRDINECLGMPCLNGGTCLNRDPGYQCQCPHAHVGDHCEGVALAVPSLATSVGALILLLSWTLLFMAIGVAVWVMVRRRCRRMRREKSTSSEGTTLDHSSSEDDPRAERITIMKIISLNGKSSSTSKGFKGASDVDVLNGSGEVVAEGAKRLSGSSSGGGVEGVVGGGNSSKRCGCSHASSPVGGGGGGGRDTGVGANVDLRKKKKLGVGGESTPDKACGCHHLSSADDLRYYAYEGEGSSPGSLSSCCSGGDGIGDQGFLSGFQDVASLLNCLTSQPSSQSPSLRQKGHAPNGSSQELTQKVGLQKGSPLGSSLLQMATTGSNQSTVPDITASVIHTADVVVSQKGQQKREIGVIPRKVRNLVSFGDERPCDIHLDDFSNLSKSNLDKKCNSLPRCRVPTIFVNNLHSEISGPLKCGSKGTCSSKGHHHSLDRRKPMSPAYEAQRLSSDQLLDPQKKMKCSACVRVLLQQHEGGGGVFGSSHVRSFSTSTVSFLSYTGSCGHMVPGEESALTDTCPLHGYSSTSLKKKVLDASQNSSKT